MKRISRDTVRTICFLRQKGHTTRQIAARVGCSLGVVTKYCVAGGYAGGVARRGRHQKVPSAIQNLLVRNFRAGNFKVSTEAMVYLKNVHNLTLSQQTIRNILAAHGLRPYVRPPKPRLRASHRRARYEFAKRMKLAPKEFWNGALFTDESKFNLYGHDGPRMCWRNSESRLLDSHVRQVVKYGGGSVMVWGVITPRGVGRLVFIDGRMDAQQYVSILASGYVSTLVMYGYDVDHTFIVQDNDPKHVSRRALEWFAAHNIRVLEWPSCSPDMNIIEHVWNNIKMRLAARSVRPNNMAELKAAVTEEWYATPLTYIQALYDSIERRISALHWARGSFTKY